MKTFLKPLTTQEETFYLRKCRQGDKAARDVLIERNLRLVAHIVKKYQGVDEDLDDLISIGTIGLIKAVSTYDMTKGSRLATYAARCIDNELLMMLRSRKKFSREVSLYEPIGTDKGTRFIFWILWKLTNRISLISVSIRNEFFNCMVV